MMNITIENEYGKELILTPDELRDWINKKLDYIKELESIKSDWIDSGIVGNKFPDDYIKGKKELRDNRKYYERQLREQQDMLTVATKKCFKLLKECNFKFRIIKGLREELRLRPRK